MTSPLHVHFDEASDPLDMDALFLDLACGLAGRPVVLVEARLEPRGAGCFTRALSAEGIEVEHTVREVSGPSARDDWGYEVLVVVRVASSGAEVRLVDSTVDGLLRRCQPTLLAVDGPAFERVRARLRARLGAPRDRTADAHVAQLNIPALLERGEDAIARRLFDEAWSAAGAEARTTFLAPLRAAVLARASEAELISFLEAEPAELCGWEALAQRSKPIDGLDPSVAVAALWQLEPWAPPRLEALRVLDPGRAAALDAAARAWATGPAPAGVLQALTGVSPGETEGLERLVQSPGARALHETTHEQSLGLGRVARDVVAPDLPRPGWVRVVRRARLVRGEKSRLEASVVRITNGGTHVERQAWVTRGLEVVLYVEDSLTANDVARAQGDRFTASGGVFGLTVGAQ